MTAAPAPGSRRRLPIRRVLWAIGAVGIAAAAGAVLYTRGGSGEVATAESGPATAIATVERRDLVETETLDGTLAYTGSRAVIHLDASSSDTSSAAAVTTSSPVQDSTDTAIAIAYAVGEPDGETVPTDTTPTETEPTDTTPTDTTPTDTTPTETEPTVTEPTVTEPTVTEPSIVQPVESGGVAQSAGGETGQTSASDASGSTGSTNGTGSPGIVTWLPEVGATVGRGDTLYRVDGKPIVLMIGKLPAWRTLKTGVSDGPDVRQLELNLVELGYDPKGKIVVDEHFGPATKAAVKRWQKDLGISRTGAVRLGRVVFLPGQRRVSSLSTEVGARLSTGATVMETTSRRQVVTVALETTKRSLVEVGDAVTVELPDGGEVSGEITGIGSVATSSAEEETGDAQGAQSGTADASDATIDVEIRLTEASAVELDLAPVDVEVRRDTRADVLAVPVAALLALAGGGYAIEVLDGAATRLVAVEPGMFADGYVEIEGDGVTEGMEVVVPA